MTKETKVEKAIQAFSNAPSFFPPGRQALAELSLELDVEIEILREVIAQLSVGLLKFVEPRAKSETPVSEPEPEISKIENSIKKVVKTKNV